MDEIPAWLGFGTAFCTEAGSGSGTAKPVAPAGIARCDALAAVGSGEEGWVGGSLLLPSCLSGRRVSLISNGFFLWWISVQSLKAIELGGLGPLSSLESTRFSY